MVDRNLVPRYQSCDGQRHPQPVITVAADDSSMQWGWSLHHEAIRRRIDAGAQAPELCNDGGDAVGLFDAQLLGIADGCLALSLRCCDRQDGELIDHAYGGVAADLNTVQGGATHPDISYGLASLFSWSLYLHLAAHTAEHIEQSRARWVGADVFHQHI